MGNKFRIMKFDGDDMYSWAVFYAKDVKGMRSPICGSPNPIVGGMVREEAAHYKRQLEKKEA